MVTVYFGATWLGFIDQLALRHLRCELKSVMLGQVWNLEMKTLKKNKIKVWNW